MTATKRAADVIAVFKQMDWVVLREAKAELVALFERNLPGREMIDYMTALVERKSFLLRDHPDLCAMLEVEGRAA